MGEPNLFLAQGAIWPRYAFANKWEPPIWATKIVLKSEVRDAPLRMRCNFAVSHVHTANEERFFDTVSLPLTSETLLNSKKFSEEESYRMKLKQMQNVHSPWTASETNGWWDMLLL